MPLRNSKKINCLKCNSFYSKCTFINKILKSTVHSTDFFWRRRQVNLLSWGREKSSSLLAFGPGWQRWWQWCIFAYAYYVFWGQLFKATQSYELVVGVTKDLPSIEGFKHLETRHTITRGDHAMPVEINWNNQMMGNFQLWLEKNMPFQVAVFCHLPQGYTQVPCHSVCFAEGLFLCCWTRE